MKKALKVLFFACLTIAVCTGNLWATPYADYADATGYVNGNTYDINPSWQRLGSGWTGESGPIANNGDADDGVFWSVNGGAYGHDAITVGDKVTFEFIMYKELWGTHLYDALRVWMDWNQNLSFDDDGVFYQDQWNFTSAPGYVYGDGSADISKNFYTTIDKINVTPGDYWLRARVVCSRDLGGGNALGVDSDLSDINRLTPTGGYDQGETEDWKFTVNSVPEPTTLLLLGMGLLGLAGIGRKLRK